ncbi:membrane protein insertase YidC [Afifella marina]|uniref:Membrane protein insertase YidC n=1 Tax=Afifella marina DSM 2698 TaxID=1120955 RepID=A0A1G5NB83_AFIMA|nr:membrane protein insertase YidC [Afifella marina]MBK1623122.1 membrane protein insertase YidC [Afifella marina DSM 2698]MBK1626116.1 membrane protein insertase YidC [Afifella marina]MBK5916994.1 membrane protein insertase YidC [Afifella marina]RAI21995.1 membrane protein insertase YidC [Afifella marina DSM 2698]SCZ34208.1 protein translocase subunit yidC [Afifella marina DSM 2698]
MDNNRNVIIAIALSLAILLGWQYFVAGPRIEAQRQQQQAEVQQATDQDTSVAGTPGATAPGGADAPAGAAPQIPPSASETAPATGGTAEPAADTPRLAVDTPALQGSISLVGGRIDELDLKRYHATPHPKSPMIELFSPIGSADPYYADFGWVASAGGPAVPDANTVWQTDAETLTPDKPVTLTWDNGQGLVFKRQIAVDDNYMFTVSQSVENSSGAPVTLYPYGLISRHGTPGGRSFYILHEGPIGVFGDEGLKEVKYSDLEDESVTPAKTNDGWLGITDKYWASALIPRGESPFQGRFLRTEDGTVPTYQADFLGDAVTVQPGASANHETLLFAGAKVVTLLKQYEQSFDIDRLDLLIDWGWFYFLTKPMFFVIDFLFHFLGNFGLAILAVTVIVKAIFFPLANKSYASMSKMKKMQPQIKKLQERYKDDKPAMQKEMMELYRREKINPLAGCWPVLIQIPVFFSLYKVLFVTIEMRHAPFFGWIHDLSAPDPTNIFNLFGLLPFEASFLHLGVWPLIMGLTMFVQMRMNPQPPDKTQAMIFNWMPLIFMFMLASFPAGLVIYWAWNNFLSVLQQGIIMRRNGVKIELWDNVKGLFGRKSDTPAE